MKDWCISFFSCGRGGVLKRFEEKQDPINIFYDEFV